MARVFTKDWLEQLKHRYEKPGISAPPVFRVATTSKFQPIRDEIENWFSSLPVASQEKLLINLRNPNSFIQTYNELSIAGFLLQFNYEIEYENEIEGLTPDWLVRTIDKTEFIVEVFSRVVSNKEKLQQVQISELWERLRKIPVGVGIFLRYENLSNIPKLDSGVIKKIATEVRLWLEKEKPEPNTVRTFYGVIFEIKNYNSKWFRPALAGPSSGAFVVNNEPIREGIEEKVRKYKDLTTNLNLPLIVAIVPSFDTAIDVDDIEEVLFDKELFIKRPVLSAVIGLWRDSMCNYRTAVYHNPNALYPLTEKMLKI